MYVDWLYRIVLKSNCDTPIDVWLVSGHHQHQQKEDDEVAFDNPHAAMPVAQVKHAPDGLAGKTSAGIMQNVTAAAERHKFGCCIASLC